MAHRRIYKHEGRGHHIGSCIIVQASSKQVARGLIRKELDRQGLSHEELNVKLHPINEMIVYVHNGDY